MSFCKQEGKDQIIFVTKEDHEKPSTVELPELDDDQPGLLLPNGDINWNCPCLGGMAIGPCGVEFREAFSCFHYSGAEPKGSDCYEQFKSMQDCMVQYPSLYPTKDEAEAEAGIEEEAPKATEAPKAGITARAEENNGSGDHAVNTQRGLERSLKGKAK